ncbi:MAG: MGMT family protein [Candidatus Altiarchaeota archaeon]|nr:MGMT family protein [Candidatus Altiarchaeota archaeon]
MDFGDSVLAMTEKIPRGRVTNYGEIAKALGDVRLARAVGQALKKNPRPVKVPCHRVVCSDGRIGGYSRGVSEKIKLLSAEGIVVENNRILDLERIFVSSSELIKS